MMYALLLIAVALLPYLPLLKRFFWSDDWYILSLSQISHMSEFVRFFSFRLSEHVTPVYRPLSTEAFYFVMQKIFGLNPMPYHFVSFAVWALGGYMLYLFLKELFSEKYSTYILFFYLFSASHFTRLSYIAAFQEVLMFTTGIAAVYCFHRKKYIFSMLFFVAALLSKESAVVILPLMVLTTFFTSKSKVMFKKYFPIIPFTLVLMGYLYMRFVVRGIEGAGSDYAWDFSLLRAAHTATWYGLWSLGLPEFVIDYVGNGGRIISRFWSDFGIPGKFLIGSFGLLLGVLGAAGFYWIKNQLNITQRRNTFLFALSWFFIGLAPLMFLPTHKYALGASVALVGIACLLTEVVTMAPRILKQLCLGLFLLVNLFSIYMYYHHHVSQQRSTIAKNLYDFMQHTYPQPLQEPTGFYFTNDGQQQPAQWGQSRQIHQAVGDHFFKVIYKTDRALRVLYEDDTESKPTDLSNWIILPSQQFLNE